MLTALNLVLGVTALAGIFWDVSSGQIGSMDGNFLILVCLLLAAMFLGSFFSSLRNGGLKMARARGKKSGTSSKDESAK